MNTDGLQILTKLDADLLRTALNRMSWSYRAMAEYLQADRATIKIYAEKVCVNVDDYFKFCPVKNGKVEPNSNLTQYQFWVLAKSILLARYIKTGENGKPYRDKVARGLKVYQRHLSLKVFIEHLQSTNLAA